MYPGCGNILIVEVRGNCVREGMRKHRRKLVLLIYRGCRSTAVKSVWKTSGRIVIKVDVESECGLLLRQNGQERVQFVRGNVGQPQAATAQISGSHSLKCLSKYGYSATLVGTSIE
jgi:hypothetical protein